MIADYQVSSQQLAKQPTASDTATSDTAPATPSLLAELPLPSSLGSHGTLAMPGQLRNSSYAHTAHALLTQICRGLAPIPEVLTPDHHRTSFAYLHISVYVSLLYIYTGHPIATYLHALCLNSRPAAFSASLDLSSASDSLTVSSQQTLLQRFCNTLSSTCVAIHHSPTAVQSFTLMLR